MFLIDHERIWKSMRMVVTSHNNYLARGRKWRKIKRGGLCTIRRCRHLRTTKLGDLLTNVNKISNIAKNNGNSNG